MKNASSFEKQLKVISNLWKKKEFDKAFEKTAKLLELWPGNPKLYILWATFLQLQGKPKLLLSKAKKALTEAVVLNPESPIAIIELAYYLHNVEDKPKEAAKMFNRAVAIAKQNLMEALSGQAKVYLDLNKPQEASKETMSCVLELLSFEDKRRKS